MKYAKKMRLVECTDNQNELTEPNIRSTNLKDEDYSTPKALQNLDKEMETILNDTTTDINQKWLLYHQALQRYLGFIKRMHYGDYTSSTGVQAIAAENPANSNDPNSDLDAQHNRAGVSRTTSTPKNSSRHTTTLELPIRIRNRILRKRNRSLKKKIKRNILDDRVAPTHFAAVDSDDDDDDFYVDVDSRLASDVDGEGGITERSLTKETPVVVHGWSPVNITP